MNRFIWEGRIYWSDTDAAGIAHFTSILRIVERAEEDLYRSGGIGDVHTALPRVEVCVRYRYPLRWSDRVRVELFLEEARVRGLRYGFKIYNVSADRLAAEGYVAVACVRLDGSSDVRAVECPKALIDLWRRFS